MASFKTHISFGVLIGIVAAALALSYSLISDNMVLFWIFCAVFIGSILPDLDSDDSTPVKVLFMIIGAVSACLAVLYLFQEGETDLRISIGIPVIIFILVRFGVSAIFKKFTKHRGIFHSIPALLIAMIGSFMLLDRYDMLPQDKIIIALALGAGFLGHLILDEMKSTVGFHGLAIRPKKSLGTAFKLFSHSKKVTVLTYLILSLLVYLNLPAIERAWQVIYDLR